MNCDKGGPPQKLGEGKNVPTLAATPASSSCAAAVTLRLQSPAAGDMTGHDVTYMVMTIVY
jgi:hypothetical protein